MPVFRSLALGVVGALALTACTSSLGGETAESSPEPAAASSPTDAATTPDPAVETGCPVASDGVAVGTVVDPDLDELSGIVASRQNPGVLWVHNDSGDDATLYALGSDGATRASFVLSGVKARDWEDIAIGPGPEQGRDYLYVADIGDNKANQGARKIIRVPEPAVASDVALDAAGREARLEGADVLEYRYPEGPRDAETLLSDPRTGDLYIVSKVMSGTGTVFRWAAPQSERGVTTLERLGAVPISGPVTGGDISADAGLVGLRTYGRAYIFPRGADATVVDALAGEQCRVTTALEAQGEAFAFGSSGDGYLTVGEAVNPPVWEFRFGG